MKLKHISALILLMIVAASFIGCSNSSETDTDSSEEASESNHNYEDEMDIAVTAQPPTLDSAMTVSQVALDIGGNVFETLVTLNEDYETVPMLAESIDVSEDGKTYTFNLREGVQFHNGEEMNAEDVVASMNRWLEVSSRANNLLSDANFEEEDTYTVVLNLEESSSDVLTIMAAQTQFPAIMPKEVIESADSEGVSEYIGTGPFKLEEWKQDQYIHLVKYEDYQALEQESSGFAGKKEAFVNDVYYHFVTDHSTRISGIQTGEYDIVDNVPIENYEQLNTMDNVNVHPYAGGTLTMFFNTNEGPLANVEMRQVVNTALNMDEIMLASYVDEELFSLDPGYMNPDQTQWQTDAGSSTYNQGDLEKSKTMLEETGYNGEEITLLTTSDYAEMYDATIVVQEQLRQLGMNVEVANFDFPTFLERKNDPEQWDIFITSNGYNLTPPQLLAVTSDWAGLEDEKVTELLEKIRGAESDEEASEHWKTLQGHLYDNLSSTVIGHYNSLVATSDKLEDFDVFEAPIIWNTKVIE
ncbi:ABC transporter substrate-binding protein [Lentibacillus salinarum]|uniref:ABC transporter substrate-binding protein n=1 Tax=Lentibacillus salinarum TaxID=446820 RepID=A0ABW3ZPG5_9BACI